MHPIEYLLGLLLAFFLGFGEYQDIVHVDDELSFCDHISKGRVHESLEGQWQVTLSKEHDQRFINTVRCDECSFPFVSFFDSDVVIPPPNVHFGDFFQFVDEGRNERERIGILDSMFIEVLVVLARAKSSFLLLNKEEGRGLR